MTPVRYRGKEITGDFTPLNIEDFDMFATPAFAQAAGGGFAGGLGGFMPLVLIFWHYVLFNDQTTTKESQTASSNGCCSTQRRSNCNCRWIDW